MFTTPHQKTTELVAISRKVLRDVSKGVTEFLRWLRQELQRLQTAAKDAAVKGIARKNEVCRAVLTAMPCPSRFEL
jgi:hypothetical protein